MEKIPNPFPQVGAPGGKRIPPVGYDLELEEIKNLIKNNAGEQLIIINMVGEYGQGKTTILEEIKEKFSKSEDEGGWGKLEVFAYNLEEIPDLVKILTKTQSRAKQIEKGIVIFLDEAQKLVEKREGEELSLEEKKFLNDYRDFIDNRIEKIDNKYFNLVLSLHPETFKVLFGISGRVDVSERAVVKMYKLKDLDYFFAYEIIRKYMESEGYNIEDFFDESVINSIFAVTPWVHEQREGLNKKNPRTFVQIFFVLFEEVWREVRKKIDINKIKNILINKNPHIKVGDASVSLQDPEFLKNSVTNLDKKSKDLFHYLLFNPKWHILNDIPDHYKDIISKFDHAIRREAILLQCKNYNSVLGELDTKPILKDKFIDLEKERILQNGSDFYIIFIDIADDDIREYLTEKMDIIEVIRISDEYLKKIYGFSPEIESKFAEKIKGYLDKEPSLRQSSVQEILLNELRWNKRTCSHISMKYPYIDGEFEIIPESPIKYEVAIFYHPFEYSDSIENYLSDIKTELESIQADLGIIFLDPYTAEPKRKGEIKIRKMANRLFIEKLDKKNLGEILNSNIDSIEKIIKDSIDTYINEAVERGFTIPFTGLKEKVKNKPDLLLDIVSMDIDRSLQVELEREFEGESISYSSICLDGDDLGEDIGFVKAVDGDLNDVALQTLSEFMEFAENRIIIGSKVSKYEKQFLDLFGEDEVQILEIERDLKSYFSNFSRISPFKFLSKILETRKLIEIKDERIRLIDPNELLSHALELIKKINEEDIPGAALSRTEKMRLGKYQLELDNFSSIDFSIIDENKKSIYNKRISHIIEKISEFYCKPDDELIQEIKESYQNLNYLLLTEIGGIKLEDTNLFNFEIQKSKRIGDNETSRIQSIMKEYELTSDNFWQKWSQIMAIKLCLASSSLDKETIDDLSVRIYNLLTKSDTVILLRSTLESVKMELERLNVILYEAWEFLANCINEFSNTLINYGRWKAYENITYDISQLERKDVLLENLEIEYFGTLNENVEKSRLKELSKSNLFLLESYINFLKRHCHENTLENLDEISKEIENLFLQYPEWQEYASKILGNGGSTFFEKYIGFVKGSPENVFILLEALLMNKKQDDFSDNDFKQIIRKLGYKPSKIEEIFNDGLLYKNTITSEFRDDGSPKKKKEIRFKIRWEKVVS